jgi:hypothetical protein
VWILSGAGKLATAKKVMRCVVHLPVGWKYWKIFITAKPRGCWARF